MNEETQKLVDDFLQECPSVDIFGYTLGVFIVHIMGEYAFYLDFKKFNESNGIRFDYVIIKNNMIAIQER